MHVSACRTQLYHEALGCPLRFIDLDWAGPAGHATYPPFMNHTHIKWPDGVTTNAPVLAEHDVSMAMQSFDLLVFEQKQLRLQKGRAKPVKPSGSARVSMPAPAKCLPSKFVGRRRFWPRRIAGNAKMIRV